MQTVSFGCYHSKYVRNRHNRGFAERNPYRELDHHSGDDICSWHRRSRNRCAFMDAKRGGCDTCLLWFRSGSRFLAGMDCSRILGKKRTAESSWLTICSCFVHSIRNLLGFIACLFSDRSIQIVRTIRSDVLLSGCSIPVVRTLRVRVDRVRFPAPRQKNITKGIRV